jgi:hypothetical protein
MDIGERKNTESTRKIIKILLGTSIFLSFASYASCRFGVQHEINKIPPEVRAGMSDFDWIGIQWIALGAIALLGAILLAMIAAMLWMIQRQRKNALNISVLK